MVKILQLFVAFSENLNLNRESKRAKFYNIIQVVVVVEQGWAKRQVHKVN